MLSIVYIGIYRPLSPENVCCEKKRKCVVKNLNSFTMPLNLNILCKYMYSVCNLQTILFHFILLKK